LAGSEAEPGNHVYRGKDAPPIGIKGVFAKSGDIVIELIDLLWDAPSALRDLYPDGGRPAPLRLFLRRLCR